MSRSEVFLHHRFDFATVFPFWVSDGEYFPLTSPRTWSVYSHGMPESSLEAKELSLKHMFANSLRVKEGVQVEECEKKG